MTAQITPSTIPALITAQRDFFATGQTKNYDFRVTQLQQLQQGIQDREEAIIAAIYADLGRPALESYFEMAPLSEIKLALKQLKNWIKPQKVAVGLGALPGSGWIQPEPLGIVLIIGPWNYPFQLIISPLVGAIAAGNCVILKPSEHAPHTSTVVADMISAMFPKHYIAVVEGDVATSQRLLAEKFNHILFTGGAAIGRAVMKAAAEHLTPVTLELGGKSPCIVDTDIHVEHAARRIVWGKFINAGQTCVAPDYLLIHRTIKADLLTYLQQAIRDFYGENPATSPDYGRIIHQRHFNRLTAFLDNGHTVIGGQANPETRFIAPTLLDNITWDDPIMQDEIFGPILPILTYNRLDDALAQVNAHPKPLALYFFSRNKQKQQQVLSTTSSGGACINDTVLQFTQITLPFGGVGQSGIGSYHGKASFDTFSHRKSILKKGFWVDVSFRYAPYTTRGLNLVKRIITY
ncbi:aldehyde dehydrogenase [Acaryochloris sp. IP29b_bin.137]|uniref:aldehyde dehydrogenase n=1 Tax=Acaryochloris sp. IP29b_bin.137 TaxID=2969217 RepID=UPI00260F0D7D|nr:aldehyde dehydrogenase [Acaryochloris sp. IP29b_bin.137]